MAPWASDVASRRPTFGSQNAAAASQGHQLRRHLADAGESLARTGLRSIYVSDIGATRGFERNPGFEPNVELADRVKRQLGRQRARPE